MTSQLSPRLRRHSLVAVVVIAGVLMVGFLLRQVGADPPLTALVERGQLVSQLTATGMLKPVDALTYRSPVVGRELEIVELVSEGQRVREGDVVVRLDTTELTRDVDRMQQEMRQVQMDLQLAHVERQEAEAAVTMVAEGEGALSVAEARLSLESAERKLARLNRERDQLAPLLAKGFITREEFDRTEQRREEAEQELGLVRKRTDVMIRMTHPREGQRAAVQLAQKTSQLESLVTRVQEAEVRLQQVRELIDLCTIRARRGGLIVYESFLSASPRRKIRLGDRVTPSQGLVTIPEIHRMFLEATIGEAELHRVATGQPAAVRLEAFPNRRLTGKVSRVGTLASVSVDRPFDDKRFDLIIELDESEADLRPEMTGRADIVVGRKDDALLLPVTGLFEKQGHLVAYVESRSGVEMRYVEIGESNNEFAEVLRGLSANERVRLTDPMAVQVTKSNGSRPGEGRGREPGSDRAPR